MNCMIFTGFCWNCVKKNKALRAGDPSVLTHRLQTNANDRVFAFLRSCEGQEVCVLLNLSADPVSCSLPDAALRGMFKNSYTNEPFDADRTRTLDLAPWSFFVFEK